MIYGVMLAGLVRQRSGWDKAQGLEQSTSLKYTCA